MVVLRKLTRLNVPETSPFTIRAPRWLHPRLDGGRSSGFHAVTCGMSPMATSARRLPPALEDGTIHLAYSPQPASGWPPPQRDPALSGAVKLWIAEPLASASRA